MVRKYFPLVDLREVEDEEFAMLACDAEWLRAQEMQMMMSAILGAPPKGAKNNQKQNNRPAARR